MSDFVWKQLAAVQDEKQVRALYSAAIASGDSTLFGKALEFDIWSVLRAASRSAQSPITQDSAVIPFQDEGLLHSPQKRGAVQWKVQAVLDYDGKSLDAEVKKHLAGQPATAQAFADVWLHPTRFNQGAWDFVRLRKVADKLGVDFQQATRAGEHDVKMWHIETLLQHVRKATGLELGEMTFYIVRDSAKAAPAVTPASASATATMLGWKRDQIRLLAFEKRA